MILMSRALIGLHWLPVDKRIEYKLLLYTYKALHDLVPGYLCELVVPYNNNNNNCLKSNIQCT